MKKIKSLLLTAVFSICSLAFAGKVYAADSFFYADSVGNKAVKIVCQPSALEAGGEAKCYLVGVANTGASAHGFVTQVYTTKNLQLKGVSKNPGLSTADAIFMASSATSVGNISFDSSKMPDSMNSYKCAYDSSKASTITDYGCAIFYTVKTASSNAYTQSSFKAGLPSTVTSNISTLNGGNSFGLIGSYEVKLADDDDIKECGEICVKVWDIKSADDYNKCESGTMDTEKCISESDEYFCTELSKKPTTPPPTPEDPKNPDSPDTGAFASYAVLAAGALIAISAVAMAKKHSKFNKI